MSGKKEDTREEEGSFHLICAGNVGREKREAITKNIVFIGLFCF